ncbi:hypothetical protein E3Q11_03859 [Wallemia mellicola]|nr:hypothetical protein E3Q11_03859 [Wallemia mellicola]
MSDEKSQFDKILETNPEFLNWAKKEAMFHPPNQSESVSKFVERRLSERGWPNDVEKILLLIRNESNGQSNLVSQLSRLNSLCLMYEYFLCVYQLSMDKPQPISARDRIIQSVLTSHKSRYITQGMQIKGRVLLTYFNSTNALHRIVNHNEMSKEDEESYAIKAKIQNSITQLPNDPVQISKTIISCINNAEFEADGEIRVLALEATKKAKVDEQTENKYINVWSNDKRAIELLSAWFKDACSTRISELKEWRSTHLPLLLFMIKVEFDNEILIKYNFLELVKRLCASNDPSMLFNFFVRYVSLTPPTDVSNAAKKLQNKWTHQIEPSMQPAKMTGKRSSSEINNEVSKKAKIENKPNSSLFSATAKPSLSKLPSFKKAPKVQEIPMNQAPTPTNVDVKIPPADTVKPAPKAPVSAPNKQNPFADSLAMMSQEQQKKKPTPAPQTSKPQPPTSQREQEKRQVEPSKKKKQVRWVPERELVSVRYIESRAEQGDVSIKHNSLHQLMKFSKYHQPYGDARKLEMDEGAMLRKHVTTEDEDKPQEWEGTHKGVKRTGMRTQNLRPWFEPYVCNHSIDLNVDKGAESIEKGVQEHRETTTMMATYINESDIPSTPSESKKPFESLNDDSKTIRMIRSDVNSTANQAMFNPMPGSQFGQSFGAMPGPAAIQPQQQDLINQLLSANANSNFAAYDLPSMPNAFYQHNDRENDRDRSRDRDNSYSRNNSSGNTNNYNYQQKPKYDCKFFKSEWHELHVQALDKLLKAIAYLLYKHLFCISTEWKLSLKFVNHFEANLEPMKAMRTAEPANAIAAGKTKSLGMPNTSPSAGPVDLFDGRLV